jgi:heme/copper-type cytochrome/quinol oxidase subunit 2
MPPTENNGNGNIIYMIHVWALITFLTVVFVVVIFNACVSNHRNNNQQHLGPQWAESKDEIKDEDNTAYQQNSKN